MKAGTNSQHVVACIPYYRCPRYIRRAVNSLLQQTHKDISVVVMNDADHQTPPWPVLADIRDPRLIRFDLKENNGPYFATQVLLLVTKAPYFLIQDADDWSHPQRVEILLHSMLKERSHFSTSAQPQITASADGTDKVAEVRWVKSIRNDRSNANAGGRNGFQVNKNLDPQFRYRLPHHGLFQTQALRNIGGYHPAFRINYDCVVTNLMLMTGAISHVPAPLYYRFRLNNSITHSPRTGIRSPASQKELRLGSFIYAESYTSYLEFLKGHITKEELSANIRHSLSRFINDELKTSIHKEADRFIDLVNH